MSDTELTEQMQETRNELVIAVKNLGIISECLELQNKILKNGIPQPANDTYSASVTFSVEEYKMLTTLWDHMYNAVKRGC